MDRDLELSLIDRCLEHHAAGTTTSAPRSDLETERHLCPDRFRLEMDQVVTRLPFPVTHASTLRESNDFGTMDTRLGELLLTRDEAGRFHLFTTAADTAAAPW